MVLTGVVVGGKPMYEGLIPLPDGTPIHITPAESTAAPREPVPSAPLPSLHEQLKDVIGKATGLPEDYSVNLDHYLYGLPKQQP